MTRVASLQGVALEVRKIRSLLPSEDAEPENRSSRVQVLCRFRGQSDAECKQGGRVSWDINSRTAINMEDTQSSTPFSFDHILGPDASQMQVYDLVEPIVCEVLKGNNAAVMCYGQTSAGKTFTMEGRAGVEQGIIPRALSTLFGAVPGKGFGHLRFQMSMFEIYNERLRDLLDPDSSVELRIIEDSHGVTIHGLHEVPITNCQHALGIFHCGQQHRKVAATGMNDKSSRSHSIFMLKVVNSDSQTVGKLSLVDLAGSECVEKARCRGEGVAEKNASILEEAKSINQSLSTLGLVIARLAGRNRLSGSRISDAHVPYRSSKLTRALQDTIGGNSRTLLVINCSASSLQVTETLSTLRFGSRARSVVNTISTAATGDVMLATLRSARLEIERLQGLSAASNLPLACCPFSGEAILNRTLPRSLSRSEKMLSRSLSRSVSPSKRRCSGRMLETHSEGCSLSPITLSPRSKAASRRVSGAFRAPGHPLSAPGSRDRSISPLPLSMHGSRRQSRRLSHGSRVSLAASDGPPLSPELMSPLSLSPRSAVASRKVSRRNSRRSSRNYRLSTGTDALTEDLELSKTTVEVSAALPRSFHQRSEGDDGGARSRISQWRSCGIKHWEFPMSHQERTIRLLEAQVRSGEKADNDAEQREVEQEKLLEQLRRSVEERNALQAENEMLQAERVNYVEQAVRSWMLEESPMAKFGESPATPKPSHAWLSRRSGALLESPVRRVTAQLESELAAHAEDSGMEHPLSEQFEADKAKCDPAIDQLQEPHEVHAPHVVDQFTAAETQFDVDVLRPKDSHIATLEGESAGSDAGVRQLARCSEEDVAGTSETERQLRKRLEELEARHSVGLARAQHGSRRVQCLVGAVFIFLVGCLLGLTFGMTMTGESVFRKHSLVNSTGDDPTMAKLKEINVTVPLTSADEKHSDAECMIERSA